MIQTKVVGDRGYVLKLSLITALCMRPLNACNTQQHTVKGMLCFMKTKSISLNNFQFIRDLRV